MALTLMLQTTRWLREQDADGDGRLSYKVITVVCGEHVSIFQLLNSGLSMYKHMRMCSVKECRVLKVVEH